MKGKYEIQLRNVFLKIAAIFICMFMIAASMVLISFFKSKNRKTIQQAVHSVNSLAEISTSTINSVLNALIQNTAIQNWDDSTQKVDLYYNAVHVMNALGTVRTTFSVIPFFSAVTKLQDNCMVISSYGSSSKQCYFEGETNLSEQQAKYILDYFSKNTGELVVPVYDQTNALTDLYYIFRKPYNRSDLIYILHIPKTSFLGENDQSRFFIYNDNKVLAYSCNDPSITKKFDKIFQQVQDISLDPAVAVSEPIRLSNSDVYLSDFDKSNWKIAYVYDMDYAYFPKILAYASMVFALLSFFLYNIFRFLSNWLYRPFRDVLDDLLPANSLETIDEFDLIRNKAITANKLSKELQMVMQQNSSLLSQKFYRDLILGLDVSHNLLYERFLSDTKNYCVALFEFQEDDNESLSDDIFFSKNALLSYTQQSTNIITINISHTLCVLILQVSTIEQAKELLQHINNEVLTKQEFKLALSSICTDIKMLHNYYVQARNILEYKYLYIANNILTPNLIKGHTIDNYYYPIIMENRLIHLLAQGNTECVDLFDLLVRENFSNTNVTLDALRSFIYALLGTIARAFQELKTTPQELLSHPIDYEKYYANWNHSNIIGSIRTMLLEILEAVQLRNKASDSQTLNAMKNYIYLNYSKDITLNDMADTLSISAKYCSNLFKKLSNNTFKSFLNRYRIDQAKKMIAQNPDIKIVDLSQLVGFNSSNTFIRVFSKYTGITPGAYCTSIRDKSYQ